MRVLTTCKTSRLLWLCLSLYNAFFGGMSCTRVDCHRAPTPVSCSVGGSVSGGREYVVLGVGGTRVKSSVCQTTVTVTNRPKGVGSRKCLMPCETATFRLCWQWMKQCMGNLEYDQPFVDNGRCEPLERGLSLRRIGRDILPVLTQ